jgi:hypothetical protein
MNGGDKTTTTLSGANVTKQENVSPTIRLEMVLMNSLVGFKRMFT